MWKEKSFGNFGNLNFITGAGGYLQNFINGYAGLQYTDHGFSMRPCLPPHGVAALTLRAVALASSRLSVRYNASHIVATLLEGGGCVLQKQGAGAAVKLHVQQPVAMDWIKGDMFQVAPAPESRLEGLRVY